MTQVPPPGPPASPQPVVPVCYRHPRRETYVRCTRCERPICPECMNEASVGHQCPECVAEGRRTTHSTRTVFGGTLAGTKGYVTIGLIVINVIVQVISTITARGQGLVGGGLGGLFGASTPLVNAGAAQGQAIFTDGRAHYFGPYAIADGEYYRLFTAMFLHLGPVHLLFNMLALWMIGRDLERALGPVRYLTLYLMAGLGGNVAVYLFAPYPGSAGASGAIFGLFAAYVIFLKRLGRDPWSMAPVLLILIISSFQQDVSLAGHFGGLVTGALVGFILAYAPRKNRNLVVAGSVAGLFVLMVFAVAVQTAALQHLVPVG